MVRYDARHADGRRPAAGPGHDAHRPTCCCSPTGDLTPEQRRQLYSHPLVSALLLERHHEYPRELIRAVREHHETAGRFGLSRPPGGRQDQPLGPRSRPWPK
ncbi:MAG: hypothetical protein QM777_12890 [Pseudorhodoferax sp.]